MTDDQASVRTLANPLAADYMKPVRDAALKLARDLTPEESHLPSERFAVLDALHAFASAILDAAYKEAALREAAQR